MTQLRRVGLNLLYLVPGETGGGEIYARRLVPALARARPEVEFVAFVNREAFATLDTESLGPGVELVRVDISGRNRMHRVVAEQVALPRLLRRRGVELVHSLGTTTPLRPGVPSVVTLYDVIYASHPEAHTRVMRAGMRVLVPLAARSADRIITLSGASAAEITRFLGVPPEQIDVVHLAGRPPGEATPAAVVRGRSDLGDSRLVLSVSARRPHKNLTRLLQAFAGIRSRPRPQLVLPGYSTAFDDELADQVRQLKLADRVSFLGWVPDADLEGLYAEAECFVFPSLAEGFGLPLLEALERGLPVACSRASSLPEVAGGAARYFDPLDVEDIRAALDELLSDPGLRSSLAEAGRQQARAFSWERTAEKTLAVYERARAGRINTPSPVSD
jgi:glycosyltransferase involved in cell wall biosynthesis